MDDVVGGNGRSVCGDLVVVVVRVGHIDAEDVIEPLPPQDKVDTILQGELTTS